MGNSDSKKGDQINYLDSERLKMWERITRLEDEIRDLQSRTPEVLKSAKENLKKSSEYRNRTQENLEQTMGIIGELSAKRQSVEQELSNIAQLFQKATGINEAFQALNGDLLRKVERLTELSEQFEAFLEEHPDLDTELRNIATANQKVDESQKRISIALNSIIESKREIDDLMLEIFGYEHENEENEETVFVPGVKQKLVESLDRLQKSMDEAKKEIQKIISDSYSNFTIFKEEHEQTYKEIVAKINELLPNALTAGLSSAFSKKKETEEVTARKLQKNFAIGIISLTLISLLPVAVSIISLVKDVTLMTVIERLPRLVIGILPIYIPALWFTYSSIKKLNLSKRLIEEYAHKEVLSKTYEGLNTQISSLQNDGQSEELRFRLLANFLQATAENPGKLISNYNASDHPVMEALEQSYKFQIALDKLEGIPGIGKVAAILEKKSKKKLDAKTEKIEQGLD